jgi:hypothetical protein
MSCSVAAGCHTKVKRHSFQLNFINYVRIHDTQSKRAAGGAGARGPPGRGRGGAPLDLRFSGLCVRAGVRSEHFQVEIGQVVLTSRHWKPV